MKAIEFSPDLTKQLAQLKRKDPRLFQRIEKQLKVFKQNPHHQSLRLHKLKGDLKDVWSISIDRNRRLLYTEDERIYFFSFGTHDEVYKK